jgi:putative ABC transport system permease protein
MIRNWFLTAVRHFRKNGSSSAINIFGLTVGLSSCLLIALYIRHELSYDDFQEKGDRIVRVIMEYRFNGAAAINKGNFTSVRVAAVFPRNFPEIEAAVKMTRSEPVVRYRDKLIDEKNFLYADPDFFSVFSYPLLRGNPREALAAPRQVVVTEATARRYFGDEDPMGKMLQIGSDSGLYVVTGVVRDCPSNSQIRFDFLASFSSLGLGKEYEETYWDANYTTYLLLKSPRDIAPLQAKITPFMKSEMAGQGASVNFWLEPFLSIHLHSPYGGFEPNNNILYIYILLAVAVLILVIACSTYINLSTARSIERAREVGVRKVIGAGKGQLFWQFIGESLLFCLIAVVSSLVVSVLALPAFNALTGRELPVSALFSLPFLGLAVGIAVVVSVLAGSYPALVLAKFQPVKVLKGSFKNTASGQLLRRSLIVFQFVISVFLIVSTFIIQRQLYYIRHKDLGYEREQVLVLPVMRNWQDRLALIKQQFRTDPDIVSVSRCVRTPVEGGGGYNMRSEAMPASEQMAVTANPVDEDFVRTTGMRLVAGQDFSEQDIKDANVQDPNAGGTTAGGKTAGGKTEGGTTAGETKQRVYRFIINESAARQLGWAPAEAVGKRLYLDASRPGYVKGVVRDFHFESLHNPIKSFVLFPELRASRLLVKWNGHNLSSTLSFLEAKWKELVPERPFEYRFLDEDYDKLYSAELRLGMVMNVFAGIAIVLACLGLFGLSSYAAQQRVKEIGIRKVLGASLPGLVLLLSGSFVRLAAVAILIAFPLAWWAMTKWLQDFTYRTDMDWRVYVLAGLLVLVITLLTVSIQAVKTATINPVKNLKVE